MRDKTIKKILLVEDNPGDARLLREMLKEQGRHDIAVTHAECLADAEAYLAVDTVDIVLLDLGLPDAHGLGAVRRIRAAAPRVALVVFTGLDDESLAEQVLQEGAQDHLIKGQIEGRGLLRVLGYAIERKCAEEALFAEKERAQVTLDCIGDAVVCTDIAGNITFLNPVAEKMTGWSLNEAIGRPMGEALVILNAATRKAIPNPMESAVERDRTLHLPFNCILVRRDGFEAPIEDSVAPIRNRQGEPTGAVIVFRDVSAARAIALRIQETTDHLRGATEQMKAVMDASPVAIMAFDSARNVTIWNRTAERVLGYSASEVIGHPIPTEMRIDEDEGAKGLRSSAADDFLHGVETKLRCKDGKIVDTISSVASFFDLSGAREGTVAVLTDVTERNATQRQLEQAQKMEAIGQLTGGIAHDFNNMLAVIIGNLDLLRYELLPNSEPLDLADAALQAASRGAELTHRLLAFARRQPLAPRRVGLNDLVRNIVKLLERTLGERISISLDLSNSLWPVVVDPAQLEAAIANLATNARDAMPKGGKLTIATANDYLDSDYAASRPEVAVGEYASIIVSDTGTGMTPEVVEKIFEPFFTTKDVGEGTGLGLSMVFGFIKQSGGHIAVYTELGLGTTFRLYLPRAPDGIEEQEPSPKGATLWARGEIILVVEDNPALRKTVGQLLMTLGYRVIEADGATSALAILERNKVDLLFADVVMPGKLDGYALVQQVMERWPVTKIILTSGFPESNLHESLGKLMQTVRLVNKPYSRDQLALAMRETLDA